MSLLSKVKIKDRYPTSRQAEMSDHTEHSSSCILQVRNMNIVSQQGQDRPTPGNYLVIHENVAPAIGATNPQNHNVST